MNLDYTNTWGLYPYFLGTDDELVDSECAAAFAALSPYGKVFHCTAMCGEMMILRYGGKTFRVDPSRYRIVQKPLYEVGDTVEIAGRSLVGEVADVNWHLKDNVPFYFVSINGKRLKKRYSDHELNKVT